MDVLYNPMVYNRHIIQKHENAKLVIQKSSRFEKRCACAPGAVQKASAMTRSTRVGIPYPEVPCVTPAGIRLKTESQGRGDDADSAAQGSSAEDAAIELSAVLVAANGTPLSQSGDRLAALEAAMHLI